MTHPHLFVTAEKTADLRSLADVRRDILTGWPAELWKRLVDKVEEESRQEPWTPSMDLPFRPEGDVKHANREYQLVSFSANRVRDAALVALITGERSYVEAALGQIDALFDAERWPDWRDLAHARMGLTVDLRHGQLARSLGIAYDWLHGLLTDAERGRLLDGLDRRAIQPYKTAVEAGEWWANGQTNWMTCIVGGFGILGMGLGSDHPDANWLVEIARPRMEGYMGIFGPEDEFNESVQYASATMYVVDYFLAELYASAGERNPLAGYGLSDFCRWYLHCTVPPGRVLGFGDPAADMPPVVTHFSAVAAALRDPLIQWFYLQYADLMEPTHRQGALELLYYDPTLEASPPDADLPLGRAYRGEAQIITSRSSWDPTWTPSVVYSKAAQEHNHGHADWGQVCIDGYGERLIVDLGAPPRYPRDQKERYYNYQQSGHNVLVFGSNETGGVSVNERRQGTIVRAELDDARGGAWTMDLSAVYGEGCRVLRHVVHLLPRVAVVLDEAEPESPQPVSLRWHTIVPAELDQDGRFTVRGESAVLTGQVLRLDGEAEVDLGRHEYHPPYDTDRLGEPYPKVREPFVEIKTTDRQCRILSLFCVFGPDERVAPWERSAEGWVIETAEGTVQVAMDGTDLVVTLHSDQSCATIRIDTQKRSLDDWR